MQRSQQVGLAVAAVLGVLVAVGLSSVTAPVEVSGPGPSPPEPSPADQPPRAAADGEDAAGDDPAPTPRGRRRDPVPQELGVRVGPAGPARLSPQAVRALPADARRRLAAEAATGPGGRQGGATKDGFSGRRAEQRASVLEQQVVNLLTTVAPELEGVQISRTCEPNGRTCTFEGPWPGDDFATRWVDALAQGDLGSDAMGATTFDQFERVEGAQGDTFLIRAEHGAGRVLE